MTAEILALCLRELAHRGIVGAGLGGRRAHTEAFQIRIKNTCRINCLQETVKYTVISSALDWQLSGVTWRENVL